MLSSRLTLVYSLMALAGGLLAAGCAPKAAAPVRTASSSRLILLTLTPAVPRALDPVVFTVQATGADHRPLTSTQMAADLSMPGMEMPLSTVLLMPATPGVYTGHGRFSMPGQWAVTVAVAGSKQSVAVFPVTVR